MEQVLMVIFSICGLCILVLILLQRGKGADIGASFGSGANQALFGGAQGNVLTRATSVLVAIFFVTSFALAVLASNRAKDVRQIEISPEMQQKAEEAAALKATAGEAEIPGVSKELSDETDHADLPSFESKAGSDIPE